MIAQFFILISGLFNPPFDTFLWLLSMNHIQITLTVLGEYSSVATGDLVGQLPPPHFCQDGAKDFLKIDDKIGMGRG